MCNTTFYDLIFDKKMFNNICTNLATVRLSGLFRILWCSFGFLNFFRILGSYKLWICSTSGFVLEFFWHFFGFLYLFPNSGFVQTLALFEFWVCSWISLAYDWFFKFLSEFWLCMYKLRPFLNSGIVAEFLRCLCGFLFFGFASQNFCFLSDYPHPWKFFCRCACWPSFHATV